MLSPAEEAKIVDQCDQALLGTEDRSNPPGAESDPLGLGTWVACPGKGLARC